MTKVPLSNRDFFAYVDDCDAERVLAYTWYAKKSRYGWYPCTTVRVGKRRDNRRLTLRLHRFVTNCPDDMTVDHLDFDHWNCCQKNLSIVDNVTNAGRQQRYNENDLAERIGGGNDKLV